MPGMSTCLAVLGLMALSLPAASSGAEPTVSIAVFKVKVVPIPKPGGGTWPHTGNILARAPTWKPNTCSKGRVRCHRSESERRHPADLAGQLLPRRGREAAPAGFGTCTELTLKNIGRVGVRPAPSRAPSEGARRSHVRHRTCPGGSRIRAFLGEGGLLFSTIGHSPTALEIVSKGYWINSHQPHMVKS